MITALTFSPDGWLVASGGFDGTVWVHRDDLPLAEVAVRARIRELATASGR